MGFRYRKSVKIGGLRINFSKSGVGYSYGVKGLRYTKTAKGKDRVTASIPGTGISYVAESGGKAKKEKAKSEVQATQQQPAKNYKIPLALKILAAICGVGFMVYYSGQGNELFVAVASGIIMGGLSYLLICFLYGAAASGIQSITHKDILSEKNNDDMNEGQ